MIPTIEQLDKELHERGLAMNGDGKFHAIDKVFDDLGLAEDLPELARLAEKLEPRFATLLTTRVSNLQGTIRQEQLEQLWQARDVGGLNQLLEIPSEFRGQLRAEFTSEFIAGADMAATNLAAQGIAGTGTSFNMVNAAAVADAATRAERLIVQMSKDGTRMIQGLVQQSIEGNMTVPQLARSFRGRIDLFTSMTGRPLPGSVQNVQRFEAILREQGIEEGLLRRKVERFAEKNRRWRHQNIARTETLDALNGGQQALWVEANKAGQLPPNTLREWIAAIDVRTDPECIVLDGEKVGINEVFSAGVFRPPLHPRCRCAVGLVFPGRA